MNNRKNKNKKETSEFMVFKEVSYNYNEIALTLSKKGRRKKDDPVQQLKNELTDKNIIYFFYTDEDCLYVGETDTCLWDRIMRHENPEKNSKWFKKGNKIKIIILDEEIDKYSRRNLESCFIINLLRANHHLYNKQ